MNEMNLLDYRKKDKNLKNLYFAKSHSSSKKSRKCNILNTDLKINKKNFFKNIYQRNILFNNKISLKNANSTSTSSLSSSTEKKYLTPTKNEPNSNIGNDYYINETINNKKNLFQNINISRPKLNFNYKYKKNKNLHLALGTGINRYNNIYFSGNDYGNNKELVINRSFKFHKNKLVLFRKVNMSYNNSRNNDDEKDLISKSVENFKINNNIADAINKICGEKSTTIDFIKTNNRYSLITEKKIFEKNEVKDTHNDAIYNNSTKKKKFKNIVLRPHKISKENQLLKINNFKEIALKHNIKLNKYKNKKSPEIIKNILSKFNIKPKYSRVIK